jgi:hypothetical protein
MGREPTWMCSKWHPFMGGGSHQEGHTSRLGEEVESRGMSGEKGNHLPH